MDAIRWEGNTLYLLDQTKLPVTEAWISYTDYRPVADAIRTMVVRGGPRHRRHRRPTPTAWPPWPGRIWGRPGPSWPPAAPQR